MPVVASPPYQATGLTPGTAYTVTVTPIRSGRKGTPASATFTTKKLAPTAPTGAALKSSPPTTAGATVTYTHDGQHVTAFRLERKPKTGGTWTKVADSTAATDRELKDPGPLTPGDYLWRVIAVDDTTDSAPSNEVPGTVATPPPVKLPTPAPVGKGAPTTTEFDVEWPAIAGVDATKGDQGYVVSIIPGEPTVSGVDVTTPAKPFVKVTGQIAAGTAYTVSVTAKGDGTTKTDSDAGTVDITPTEPAAKGYGEGGYGDDTYGGTA